MIQISNYENDTLLQIDILEPYQPSAIDQICEVIECMYVKPTLMIYNTLQIQDHSALEQFVKDFAASPLFEMIEDIGQSVVVIDPEIRLNAIKNMERVYVVGSLEEAFDSAYGPVEKIG